MKDSVFTIIMELVFMALRVGVGDGEVVAKVVVFVVIMVVASGEEDGEEDVKEVEDVCRDKRASRPGRVCVVVVVDALGIVAGVEGADCSARTCCFFCQYTNRNNVESTSGGRCRRCCFCCCDAADDCRVVVDANADEGRDCLLDRREHLTCC